MRNSDLYTNLCRCRDGFIESGSRTAERGTFLWRQESTQRNAPEDAALTGSLCASSTEGVRRRDVPVPAANARRPWLAPSGYSFSRLQCSAASTGLKTALLKLIEGPYPVDAAEHRSHFRGK